MSILFFSALTNGQTVAFDPVADTLFFDSAAISAANLAVSQADPTTTRIVAAGKTILLSGLTLETIDSWNAFFANGSRLLVGNDSTLNTGSGGYYDQYGDWIPYSGTSYEPDSAGNELFGGEFNDQLLGLGGDDTLNGGRGNDILNGGDGLDTASLRGCHGWRDREPRNHRRPEYRWCRQRYPDRDREPDWQRIQ